MTKKINVFIIDDSAIVREILTEKLSSHNRINVVGSAINPYIARKKIVKLDVDVIILDIEMPEMDGLTFLKYLMKYKPIPTIIVSSLVDRRNTASVEALRLGAVDIVPKPGGPFSIEQIIDSLIEKITAASEIDFETIKILARNKVHTPLEKNKYLSRIETTKKIIAIGTSTGGVKACEILFRDFHKSFPPAVMVIHMSEYIIDDLAYGFDKICPVHVTRARHNEKALPGTIYIAPGNKHLKVKAVGADIVLKVFNAPMVNFYRPSVDVLFKSVAKECGKNSIGILLTGMGRDGAEGLLEIKKNQGYTIAQDEKTSLIFGMPKQAIKLGAADSVLPLDKIAQSLQIKYKF